MLARSALLYHSIPEIEKYFWYDLENDGIDPHYNEHNFGLLHNRSYGAQPKASYSVMAFLSQLLNNANVTEDKTLSTPNRMAIRIEKMDGSIYLAVWSLKGKITIELPTVINVFGMYGNVMETKCREIGETPVFFQLK